jgi:hypothetical protein
MEDLESLLDKTPIMAPVNANDGIDGNRTPKPTVATTVKPRTVTTEKPEVRRVPPPKREGLKSAVKWKHPNPQVLPTAYTVESQSIVPWLN